MITLILLGFPLVAALLTLIAGNSNARTIALGTSVVQLLLTFYAWMLFNESGADSFTVMHSWIDQPKIGFHLAVDGLSMMMLLLTALLLPLIILSTYHRKIEREAGYFSLILFMQFALTGVFVAMDGLLYYIFWELALIPIYFIALRWGGPNRVNVTLKFFIYTLAGSLLMLFGFIALYWFTPAHSFDIADLYANKICSCKQGWVFWMFFIAYAIKIPIVPFHTWQADTYREAPTQGTMLLAGIMLKMGTYSLLRWLLPIIPDGVAEWGPLAITLSVIGVVYASVIAIMQRDLKRLFAFSSVAHVGLISAGIFAMNASGFQGASVQMLAHGVNVVGLFFCADIILNRTGSLNIDQLGGIRTVAPKFATYFMIIVLGSVALPLTNGFIGEFMLLFGVYSYNSWLGVFAGLTIILGAVYMLRMFQRAMLGNTSEITSEFPDLYWNEQLVLGVIAVIIIITGIYPKPLFDLAAPALDSILQHAVLH